ncbi:MAG TPA: aminotransferase class I/II-fold pyridoxal phosphate-dependent enzyme, partial [Anaerovoracaceae bacterium]|nr:aminotransferase class I/II-fold pyridoxal phosphate-dependent enzyme [Anaerovoracaceae bacterium]
MDHIKDSCKPQTKENNSLHTEKLIHGGDIYSAKEQLNKLVNPPAILDFSANINPLGLPEGVKQALIDSVTSFDVYPDPLCRELISGLSNYEGVPGEWILCGNGAADLIYRTVYAVKPKKAMVLAPTFAEYEEALNAVSCHVIHYELHERNGYQVEEGLLDELEEDLDMLFLCNPNNPTGQLMTKEFLLKIIRRCKALGILLFLDECFNEFLEEPQEYSAKEFLKVFDNLIILKAFTKIYAMAGIRLGHCISANGELLKKISEAGQPWSVSSPAQIAGIKAMEEREYL